MHSVAHPAAQRPVQAGSRVALLVNSLGGTPALELGVVARAAVRVARQQHQVSFPPSPLCYCTTDAFFGCVTHADRTGTADMCSVHVTVRTLLASESQGTPHFGDALDTG